MSLYKIISPKDFIQLTKTTSKSRIITVDASWHMPNTNRSGLKEYKEGPRLPNSIFFDIDDVKDDQSSFPHMLPTVSIFNKKLSNLGLLPDDTLIVYDKIGNFASPRAAWTFTTLGHEGSVYLLNNYNDYLKLNKQDSESYPLEHGTIDKITSFAPTNYQVKKDHIKDQVIDIHEVKKLVDSGEIKNYNFFDARSFDRYSGAAPEPRAGLTSGHVPGTYSLPFLSLVNSETKGLLPKEELKEAILKTLNTTGAEFDPKKPTLTMCGTGVTGVIIKTALEESGLVDSSKLYDGSWTEWALTYGNQPMYVAKKE
ncbi:hypothetical protein FOG48_01719 [Hanseniaspora uvarum]|nr:hypothetical protein FOG48_01719 [Hanseniaspora uvarum]